MNPEQKQQLIALLQQAIDMLSQSEGSADGGQESMGMEMARGAGSME